MQAETDGGVAGELVRVYRRYIGEPERVTDVYAGFGLFFGAVTLGVLAVLVFVWSASVPPSASFHWRLRGVAGALALVGLPALLLSVPVLLPTDRRATAAAAVGAVVCLVGVGVFVTSYPYHWNVDGTTDNSTLGVLVYAVGLVLLVGAGGAGLVSARIERARVGDANARGAPDAEADASAEEVSAADVERDIEEAMADSDLSWGGVEQTETTRLRVDTSEADDVERSNLTTENANVSRSESVDAAVSGLQRLRGGESKEETGAGADDQVAALQELRQRQAEGDAETEPAGPLDRIRGWLGR